MSKNTLEVFTMRCQGIQWCASKTYIRWLSISLDSGGRVGEDFFQKNVKRVLKETKVDNSPWIMKTHITYANRFTMGAGVKISALKTIHLYIFLQLEGNKCTHAWKLCMCNNYICEEFTGEIYQDWWRLYNTKTWHVLTL